MERLGSREAQCTQCRGQIILWTEGGHAGGSLRIVKAFRRCNCPVDLEAIARNARVMVPELMAPERAGWIEG